MIELKTEPLGDGMVRVTGTCVVTGKEHSVEVPDARMILYQCGAHVQDAFPELPTDEREFLISGISPEGWKRAFGGGPEDDGDNDDNNDDKA